MAGELAGASIELSGNATGVQRMLQSVDSAFSPSALILFLTEEVTPFLAERAHERFKNSGDDVSGTWQPLAPATQAIRRRGREQGMWSVGDEAPINVRTHEMEDYITQGGGTVLPIGIAGAFLTYPRPTSNAELRKKVQTAQIGGQAPGATRPTPARPVLGMNEKDLAFVLLALGKHFAAVQKRGMAG